MSNILNWLTDCTKQIGDQIGSFLEADHVQPRDSESPPIESPLETSPTESPLGSSPTESSNPLSMAETMAIKSLVTPKSPKFIRLSDGANASKSCSDLPNTSHLDQQDKKAYELLEDLILKRRGVNKDVIDDFMYGNKTGEPQIPRTCVHKHLEGSIYVSGILKLMQKHNLFWDPTKKRARRKEGPKSPSHGPSILENKNKAKRIPAKYLTEKDLIDAYAVEIGDINEQIDPKDLTQLNERFDGAFGVTGSVLDRVPLSDQLLFIHEEAVTYNIKYQELMFGVNYEIPLSDFENFAEQFHGQMTKENIEKCQDYLTTKLLEETLSTEEKQRFKRKMSQRFPEYSNLYEKLLNCSYIEAFINLMDLELTRLQMDLRKSLDVDIFDINSPYTIKLLFEVMRHYSIGKFIAWLLAIAQYIKKDPSKILGVTVDGPQKNENSFKYFADQIEVLFYVFKKYGTKFTIHALEFSKQDFEKMGEKNELAEVLKVAARIGHGTMTKAAADLCMNLLHMKVFKTCFEICPTVNHLTSGLKASEMPIDILRRFNIAWTIGTDDAGLLYQDQVPATDLRKEQLKLLDILDLSFEELEWTIREGVKSSFLEGDSIFYCETPVINNDNNNSEEARVESVYKLKASYISIWNSFRVFNALAQKIFLALRELSSKQKISAVKDCDLVKLGVYFEECAQKSAFQMFLAELNGLQSDDITNNKATSEDTSNNKAAIDKLKKSFLLLTQAYQEDFLSKLELSDKARKQFQIEMELEAFRINLLYSRSVLEKLFVLEKLELSDPRRHSANDIY